MNALKYLSREYGICDEAGKNYFLDYLIRTKNGQYAIEENGVTYHHPQIIGEEKYRNQLHKQNTCMLWGIKLFRFSSEDCAFENRIEDDIKQFLGKDASNFVDDGLKINRTVELYEHQTISLQEIQKRRSAGVKAFLIVLPTASGKSKIIEEDLRIFANDKPDFHAKEIIMFCANEPVRYKRFSSELLAMRAVGYYLNESDYSIYEKELLGKIQKWIQNDSKTLINGQNIFLCLSGVGHRMAQDKLADICCSFMESHFSRWYMDMFKFIAKTIDLNKLNNSLATRLIQDIISVMDNEQERQQVSYAPGFLCVFRKQSKDITEELDSKIAEVFPHYYNGDYLLETQSEDEVDYLAYISDYLEKIEENNLNQGKNGHYFGHASREIAIIRNILISENIICPTEVMDKMISIEKLRIQ